MAIVDDSTKTGADSKSNGGTTLRDSLLHNRKNGQKGGFSYRALEDFSDESQKQTIYEAHGDLWQDAGSDAHHQYSTYTDAARDQYWHSRDDPAPRRQSQKQWAHSCAAPDR